MTNPAARTTEPADALGPSTERHADGAAKIGIDTLEAIESTLGRRQLRFVLAWADLHQGESPATVRH
jgi:hypothetical protein